MQNLLTVVGFRSAVAALRMLALPLLGAALMFAPTVLPFFAGVTIKFVV